MKFKNFSNRVFTLDEVIEELYHWIEAEPEYPYKLMVGSDSQRQGMETVYITVVVLHRVGRGGKMFYFKNVLPHRNRIDLSVRITQETTYTVEILKKIENSILVSKVGRENLSAHVDASTTGTSKKIVNACVGLITGLGFKCEHKPDAWVASHVADKFTK